ncbi:MAG: hypothetical protein LBU68_02885 [Rickettsiales bacterium]|jgi:uncharacterized membrane protein|nr:hypothetical protein [Rickettsiales bacterium]
MLNMIITLFGFVSAFTITFFVVSIIESWQNEKIFSSMTLDKILLGTIGFGTATIYGLLKFDFITFIPSLIIFVFFAMKLYKSIRRKKDKK